MKKNLITFLFALMIFSNISAAQYWGEGIFADLGFSSKNFVPKPVPLEGSICYRKEFKEINIFSGLCFDNFSFDFSASGAIKPLQYEKFQLSMGYLSHFSFSYKSEYLNELFINDNVFFISTKFLGKNIENPLSINLSLGVDLKTTVQKLTDNRLSFFEPFPIFEVQFIKEIKQKHEIMFRLGTFDYLYFKGWLNTWWQFGYSYDFPKNLTFGTIIELLYADQFTLSGALNGYQCKLFLVYKI
jgi:hypothetical protein